LHLTITERLSPANNKTLQLNWFSKHQHSVSSSSFSDMSLKVSSRSVVIST